MNVQQLIDELSKVVDKTCKVVMHGDSERSESSFEEVGSLEPIFAVLIPEQLGNPDLYDAPFPYTNDTGLTVVLIHPTTQTVEDRVRISKASQRP